MGLDIRIPLGLMFAVMGAMLIAFGLILGDAAVRMQVNIDLWWGVVMLGFGLVLLILGRRGTSAMHSAPPEPNPEARRPGQH